MSVNDFGVKDSRDTFHLCPTRCTDNRKSALSPNRIGRVMNTLILFAVAFVFGNGEELDHIPNEAISSWAENRVGILDYQPLRISDDSCSVVVKVEDVFRRGSEERVRNITTTAHKLDSKFLIERATDTETTMEIINGTEWFSLWKAGESDWILRGRESVEDVSTLREADLQNHALWDLLGVVVGESNLFGFGRSTFADSLVNDWNPSNIVLTDVELMIQQNEMSEVGPRETKLFFDPEREFRYKRMEDRFRGNSEPSTIVDIELSDDSLLSFTRKEMRRTVGDEKAGFGNRTVRVRITEERPDPAIFELENYSIIYTSPKSQSWMPTQILVPVLIGVSFIALAVYLRRRSA